MTLAPKLNRRALLGLAPVALLAAALPVNAAEFGLAPGDADQSAAMQAALDACAKSGATLVLPAGSYRVGGLKVKGACQIIGSGTVTLHLSGIEPLLMVEDGSLTLRDLAIRGSGAGEGRTASMLVSASGAALDIANCRFSDTRGGALTLSRCGGTITQCSFSAIQGGGIMALEASGLTVANCLASGSGSTAVTVASKSREAIVTGNRIDKCGIGIHIMGPALVTGNVVSAASDYGLRLGDSGGSATVHASGNLLRNCKTGIGIPAQGDYVVAAMNTILGATDGGIRAFEGNTIMGSDLSQGSEAFMNLTAFANVVR